MDFKNANELLALCEEKNLPISEIMRIREIELGETASEIVNKKMTRVLGIMKDAAFSPIRQPIKSFIRLSTTVTQLRPNLEFMAHVSRLP